MKSTLTNLCRGLIAASCLFPLAMHASLFTPADLVELEYQAQFDKPESSPFQSPGALPSLADAAADEWQLLFTHDEVLATASALSGFVGGAAPDVNLLVDLSPSAGPGNFIVEVTVAGSAGSAEYETPVPESPTSEQVNHGAACGPGEQYEAGSGSCISIGTLRPDPADPFGVAVICDNGGTPPDCIVNEGPATCPVGVLDASGDCIETVQTCPNLGTAPGCFHLDSSSTVLAAAGLLDLDLLIGNLDWSVPGKVSGISTLSNGLECTAGYSGDSVSLNNCSGTGFSRFEVFVAQARQIGVPVPAVLWLLWAGLAGIAWRVAR